MLDISNKHEVSFNWIDSGMLIGKCASKINFPLKFRCAVRRQNRLADFNMACLIARNCNTCGTLGPMPFSTARKKISSAWDEVAVSEELCRRTSGRRKVYILILVRSCGRRTAVLDGEGCLKSHLWAGFRLKEKRHRNVEDLGPARLSATIFAATALVSHPRPKTCLMSG
jgi:hypothetical protein